MIKLTAQEWAKLCEDDRFLADKELSFEEFTSGVRGRFPKSTARFPSPEEWMAAVNTGNKDVPAFSKELAKVVMEEAYAIDEILEAQKAMKDKETTWCTAFHPCGTIVSEQYFESGVHTISDGSSSAPPSSASTSKQNPYVRSVEHLEKIDVHRILELYDVHSYPVGNAVKKLLMAGKRGAKDYEQDLREAEQSIQRELQMLAENENGSK